MIIYFSGTGNSYSVANKLAAALNDRAVPLIRLIVPATAAPSGHFLVSRKKPSVSVETHLISVSIFFLQKNKFQLVI